jgi:predicted nucleotidyltransferase/uncharacterized protein (UPF0332 family)
VAKKPAKKPAKKSEKKSMPKKITLRSETGIAMDFAEKVHRKFDKMVKATVLFGSQAKNSAKPKSDIDIVVIIDDAAINWDLELVSWYREELMKLTSQQGYSRDIHVNTIKLTTWWQDILRGDPVVINILRYGAPLIDYGGFFNPLKALLLQGRIHSTPEAVYAALQRAPSHIARSKAAELGAIEGVYWAMVDSAQAALITAGKLPPSPEHLPEMLRENFVERKMLKESYVRSLRDIYTIHKTIAHGEISDIKGAEIDDWQETAEEFLRQMTILIDKMLQSKDNGLS